MTTTRILLVMLLLTSCKAPSGSYPHAAMDIEENARVRDGDGSQVMARFFTNPEAMDVRGWGSTAGAWAFVEVAYAFDDALNDVTPEGPELYFLAEGASAPTKLPPPPGVAPRDLPLRQFEAGWTTSIDDEDVQYHQRTARFVSSPDPGLLAIRVAHPLGDSLLRLLNGAWVVEGITTPIADVKLREVGPRVAILELGDGTPAMLRDGQVTPLDTPPASLMVPAGRALQFGPFDGTSIRVFWAPQPNLICTGAWNLESGEGRRDDCIDLVTPHGGALLATGTLDDTLVSVRDSAAFGPERAILNRATPGAFETLGIGGYGLAFAHDSAFRTPVGYQPVHAENACEFSDNLYAVARFFRSDGSWGFVRCLQSLPADLTCECSRDSDLKGCGCMQASADVLGMWRTGEYTWRMIGLHSVDGRQLIRTGVWEHDPTNTTSNDPTDALEDYTGPFGYERAFAVTGNVPGFPRDELSGSANVSSCTTVTGPRGPIPMNADETFTVDIRDDHTLTIACAPQDGGPPLPVIVADAPSVVGVDEQGRGIHEAWTLPQVSFFRGIEIDADPLSTQSQHPSRPIRILTAPDRTQLAVEWDPTRDEITTRALPPGTAPLTFVPSLDLVITADGQVISLDAATLLGTVPAGTLSPDHRTWLGFDRSVTGLFADQAPQTYPGPGMPYIVRAASRSGLFAIQDATTIAVYDAASGLQTTLYSGNPSFRIDVAAVSDDGDVVALLERNYGPEEGRVLVYRRVADCASATCLPGDLPFTEELVCTNCDLFMAMVPGTSELIYTPNRNSVALYDPDTGMTSMIQDQVVESLNAERQLHFDGFGAYWWHLGPMRLVRFDPATGVLTQHDISQSPHHSANAVMHHFTDRLFRGVAVGMRVYTATPNGLEIAWEPHPDLTRRIVPLAGNRGSQVTWSLGPNQGTAYFHYGDRAPSGIDLDNAYENGAAGIPSNPQPEALFNPCDVGAPTYPDWVTSAPRGLVCMR